MQFGPRLQNHLLITSLPIIFKRELRNNDSAHHCSAFLYLSHLVVAALLSRDWLAPFASLFQRCS